MSCHVRRTKYGFDSMRHGSITQTTVIAYQEGNLKTEECKGSIMWSLFVIRYDLSFAGVCAAGCCLIEGALSAGKPALQSPRQDPARLRAK